MSNDKFQNHVESDEATAALADSNTFNPDALELDADTLIDDDLETISLFNPDGGIEELEPFNHLDAGQSQFDENLNFDTFGPQTLTSSDEDESIQLETLLEDENTGDSFSSYQVNPELEVETETQKFSSFEVNEDLENIQTEDEADHVPVTEHPNVSPSDSTQVKKTLPTWKKWLFIILGGFATLIVLSVLITLLTADNSNNGQVNSGPASTQTTSNASSEQDTSDSAPLQDTVLIDTGIFNALDEEKESITTEDFTNSDETTVSTLGSLQQQLNKITAERNAYRTEFEKERETSSLLRTRSAEADQREEALHKEIFTLKSQVQDANAQLNQEHKLRLQREEQLEEANKELSIAKRSLENNDQKRQLLEKELERERDRVERMVAADSDGLKDVTTLIAAMRDDFDKKFSTNARNQADSMLSELKLVSIDPKTGKGEFLKMKNGKAVSSLKLTSGETVIGRGKIDSIDVWGCIYFEDGGKYEPIGGFCK